VILPTYNRASFLPGAFESLIAQTFNDWDLILVDDGSTDDTREMTNAFAASHEGRVRYMYQKNRGAYAARNRGLAHATGKYIAFFDSDDLWLPHHLDRCVTALENDADVDWVFGASRQVDQATGETIEPSTFFVQGRPRPFLKLRTRMSGDLRVITDPAVLECQILHGLYCGLQNSVMRRRLFDAGRFDEHSRVVDDEMFVIRVLAAGARFGYFLEPHVIYQIHTQNSSGSAAGLSAEKQVAIFSEMTASLEQLLCEVSLTRRQRRALLKRLSSEYFWHLGYLGLWQAGRRVDAIAMFRRGLSVWPWHASAWKTYLLAKLKIAVQGASD
jgi:cellulose synthase/poly-beta-1,6-N-acetylglucosamine synthase-like glycosyltransferase